MKYISILGIALFLSCAPSMRFSNVPKFSSIEEIENWMYDNILYSDEEGDYWKYPNETFSDGYGDCEDRAILFLYIVNDSLGIKGELGIAEVQDKEYPENVGYHAYPIIEGHNYENNLYTYKIVEKIKYDSISYCVNQKRKGNSLGTDLEKGYF